MIQLRERISKLIVFNLNVNYRSAASVVKTSNFILSRMKDRYPLTYDHKMIAVADKSNEGVFEIVRVR
jgi:ATP-dependent exoDNAse (exonuclease V) beta subunit